ncbi:MAG TPA: hypothetical protein VIK86_04545 [Candidatus Paceibacterota bacterium]
MKDIFKNIIAVGAIILIIFGIYLWGHITGGPLTSADSCSGSYLKGEYDIAALRKNCPNLSKENLIEDVQVYFEKNSTADGRDNTKVINDIENNFH